MKIQSAKGFTLVELVVVIAILGILAAIAIPSVVGIINSASESATEENAAELDTACKDFYASVTVGVINETDGGERVTETLPVKGATVSAKKSEAKELTIIAAIEYAGVSSKYGTNNQLANYGYIKTRNEGTIVFKDTFSGAATDLGTLTTSTTFGDMYGR